MITSSETRVPLERFLKWLILNARLTDTSTFMIECSFIQVAAIKAAFDNREITLCYWHYFRVLNSQVKKVKDLTLRKSAMVNLTSIVQTGSKEDFTRHWVNYRLELSIKSGWIT